MTTQRVDLLIGSDIGRWMVGWVDPCDVGTVFTADPEIAALAAARGLPTASSVDGVARARVAFSAHWPSVLSAEQLAGWEAAWNLHPGLLPWGRGYGPVFWAIWAGEPAGATLHVMTSGLDRGPIVAQRAVEVRPDDTGTSLYGRVFEVRQAMVREWWPRLVAGERPIGEPQPAGGTYHARAELIALRDSPDVATMSADDLVRLCRALAMPGMPGPSVGSWRLRLAEAER
jgi:methionyl-tRNA formyltransferase